MTTTINQATQEAAQLHTSTAPVADNQPSASTISNAEKMRTTTISDNTRDYLIVIGKLDDLYSDILDCVTRDYGTQQVDKMMDELYRGGLGFVADKLYEFFTFSVRKNVGFANWQEI